MKKLFTLVAAGALVAGAHNAQAQVVVDGQLTASELTTGNYVLIGKSTNNLGNQNTDRPFGRAGLLSLYVASTPTKVYMFLAGTVETNGNAFQIFLDMPGVNGVPMGSFLPAGAAGTSFERITRIKLDQDADLALALRSEGSGTPQPFRAEAAVFTSATGIQSKALTGATAATQIVGNGTAFSIPGTATAAPYAGLNGARMAYRNTSTGNIAENPGNTTPATGAAYGGVGSFGWEIELDRAALNALTGTPSFRIFALQNSGDGGFASGEFIPQATGPLPGTFPGTNLGGAGNGTPNDVDFALVPGRQSAGFSLGPNGALSTRKSDATVALNVFPNPIDQAETTVSYQVTDKSQLVRVELIDLMGRTVSTVFEGQQAVGAQSQKIAMGKVAAGTYLVKVQVGEKVATHKVSVL